MKKLFSLLFLVFFINSYSQNVPQTINYQGVARTFSGTPITGIIKVKFDIHQSNATGPSVFAESQNATTNAFGVFNLEIGKQNTTGFSTINWGAGPYFLEVSIDPAGGTNYVSTGAQQLVSVPYALYAEKAKNVNETSITASSNVTVTSSGTNTFNISVPNYVSGSNVTITPLSGNNYQINAGNSATSIPTSPWSSTTGAVYLTNTGDNVGIGTNVPGAKLGVVSTNSIGVFVNSVGNNGVLASTSSSTSGHSAFYGSNGGGPSAGTGVTGITNSSVSAGVLGQNLNQGPGVFGVNTNGASSSLAHGVYGETNSSGINAAGVAGSNFGVGVGVLGRNLSNSSSSNAHGVFGESNSSFVNSAGVFGQNLGSGHGVYGYQGASFSSGNAVFGVSNSNNSNGLRGINNSGNAAIFGSNLSGGSIPNAHGVRGETSALNSLAAGVYGFNSGTGAGVRASISASIIAGSLNTALLVENGHITATGNPPQATVITNSITGFTYSAVGVPTNNDVRGLIGTNNQPLSAGLPGSFIEIKVDFFKPYTSAPVVVVSPNEQMVSRYSYIVSSISNVSFTVRIINNTGGTAGPPSPAPFRFTYIVIE